MKTIPAHERLIFALDVPTLEDATTMADHLGDAVGFYKIGLELRMMDGYLRLAETLAGRGKRVFADLKLFDIPATVERSVRQLCGAGISFLTVHAGYDDIIRAAARGASADPGLKILAVTVLTSIGADDLAADFGTPVDPQTLVVSRAKRAIAAGAHGIVASGLEAAAIRAAIGNQGVIVTPGIRPAGVKGAPKTDDQKRTMTPAQAFASGADYIVVGRPIKDHAGFSSPREAALAIQREIAAVF